jgi:hypothetical protein
MRKIWVVMLSVVAFTLGAFATMAYSGASGSIGSFRIACELLDKAESLHLLTREQRADVVDRVHENLQRSLPKRDADLESRFGKFKNGCPIPPDR